MIFFFQFQRLAEQWLIDRDSEYHLILDMSAKQARSPSMGSWQAFFFAFFSWTEASAKRREVRVKREAALRKTRAKPLITSSCQQPREDKLLEANIIEVSPPY